MSSAAARASASFDTSTKMSTSGSDSRAIRAHLVISFPKLNQIARTERAMSSMSPWLSASSIRSSRQPKIPKQIGSRPSGCSSSLRASSSSCVIDSREGTCDLELAEPKPPPRCTPTARAAVLTPVMAAPTIGTRQPTSSVRRVESRGILVDGRSRRTRARIRAAAGVEGAGRRGQRAQACRCVDKA